MGVSNGQGRWAAGLDDPACVIRGDASLLSVDGLNPEGVALVESRTPDRVLQKLLRQRVIREAPP